MPDLPFRENMFGQMSSGLLAPLSVLTEHIGDAQVTTAKLAVWAVTNNELAGGILGSKLADNSIPATKIEQVAWTSWTPTWTNFTLGNGSQTCKYTKIGRQVSLRVNVTLGSTSAMGTNPTFSLPPYSSTAYSTDSDTLGDANLLDAGTANWRGQVWYVTATTFMIVYYRLNATAASITATAPFTWTSGDKFGCNASYESST